MSLKIVETTLPGVVIVEPRVFEDARGSFCETFSERDLADALAPFGIAAPRFVQDNESHSRRGVVRGLHFQKPPHAQTKLVRAAVGRILDVAVDMRADSPTLGQWTAVELSDSNRRQLFIPQGFAHAFLALTDDVVVMYKVDNYYAPQSDAGVRWDDPALGIDWAAGGVPLDEVLVSPKDAALPSFEDAYKF